jgi:hypothetical protein
MTRALEEILGIGAVDRDEIFLFFKKYDSNFDGRITFSDFCQAFTPLSEEYSSILGARTQYFQQRCLPREEYFNKETRYEYANVWRTHFKIENSCEGLRERIARRPTFSHAQAFSFCDKLGRRTLMPEDLKQVL